MRTRKWETRASQGMNRAPAHERSLKAQLAMQRETLAPTRITHPTRGNALRRLFGERPALQKVPSAGPARVRPISSIAVDVRQVITVRAVRMNAREAAAIPAVAMASAQGRPTLCVRARPKPAGRGMSAVNAPMGGSMTAIVTPTLMNVLPMVVKAVSYTHLTLPTIYSV